MKLFIVKINEIVYRNEPNHPHIATNLNNIGSIYQSKGEYGKSLEYYEKSLKIREIVYQNFPNHPDIVSNLNNIGSVYRDKGEYDSSLEYNQEAD